MADIKEAAPAAQKSGWLSRLTQRFPFLKTRRGIAILVAVLLLIIGGGLAGLAALHRGAAAQSTDYSTPSQNGTGFITSDTYFYGQSPPVYPSRMVTLCPWPYWNELWLTDKSCSQHDGCW